MPENKSKMRVLDLFSGIRLGGFSLGLERAGMKTVAFCEIDPYCRRVLMKHWPDVPIFEDVRKLCSDEVGDVDVICGGYPCQGESLAGKRRGPEDDRWLWPEYRRLVETLRPAWVIGENVAGHVTMGLDSVLFDLEALGYACQTFIIPACAVDAPHRRDRVWIIAHAGSEQHESRCDAVERAGAEIIPAYSASVRCNTNQSQPRGVIKGKNQGRVFKSSRDCEWPVEPGIRRVGYGIPNRVDRLRGLGNAVVPQIPEAIGRAIMEAAT